MNHRKQSWLLIFALSTDFSQIKILAQLWNKEGIINFFQCITVVGISKFWPKIMGHSFTLLISGTNLIQIHSTFAPPTNFHIIYRQTWLSKEQTGFKELFTYYRPFYTINLLLNKELCQCRKCQNLALVNNRLWKLAKKRGL